jgi:hypothetical protein
MRFGFALVVLTCLVAGLVPTNVHAQGATQASITGVVRDASGAVLPGVTVEASSDALIEKVRTTVTDGTGRFRVVSLPPGIYVVTFALTGFTGVRREGIELSGSFTATVNVDLKVGSLEETVTVTGEAPVVDVQSAQRQQVIKSDVMASIPASRSYEMLAALVPGIQLSTTSQNVGASTALFLRSSAATEAPARRDVSTWTGSGPAGRPAASRCSSSIPATPRKSRSAPPGGSPMPRSAGR